MTRLSSGESSSTRRTSTNKNPTDQTKTSRLSGRFYAFRLLLGLTVFSIASSAARGADFYVSPSGSTSGNGNVTSPWSLAAALAQPAAVKPGDTIWLRGGTYQGTFISVLTGTADAPIIVRQYPGERAILDGGNSNGASILTVSGSYTWYWGFEVMSSDPTRTTTSSGSWPTGTEIPRGEGAQIAQGTNHPGLKFINMIVHDTRQGFSLWIDATDSETYGCLIYYNGWTAPDRSHGQGIYNQNQTGTQRIADNIIFSNFDQGIQAYGSQAAYLNNISIEGNTIFANGMPGYERNVLLGGGSVAQNPRIVNNALYFPGTLGQNLNVGYDPYGAGAANPVITGNYVVNGDNLFSSLNTNVTMTGNTFDSIVPLLIPSLYPSNIYSASDPTALQMFVRGNEYEAGRANITVFNWGNAASISVNLSAVLAVGASYEIRNAQNFFASPIRSGVYGGGSVSLPMTGLFPATPVGFAAPPETGPQFEVFVVLATSGSSVSPSPTPTRTPTPTPTRISTTPTPTATLRTPTPTPTRGAQPTLTPTPTPTPTPTKPGVRKGNPH